MRGHRPGSRSGKTDGWPGSQAVSGTGGTPIVYYSIRAFQESPLIDQILLVTGETEIDYVQSEIVEKYHFDKVCAVVAGGHERYASVWNGLKALEKSLREEEKDGFVFIHDGVRPFVNEEILRRAFDAVEAYHACVVGMPSKDTVKIADADGFVSETPARQPGMECADPAGI